MNENPPTSAPPALRTDVSRELIARAANADLYWTRLVRGQLTDGEIGRGRLVDYTNADVLRRITDAHGWPGWALVGRAGATAAWRIALRADNQPPFQRHAERLMHHAVRMGQASPGHWAHLYDRVCLMYGARQEFGTQYRNGVSGPEREPVNDEPTLDQRRSKVGLPPAEESWKRLRERLAAEPSIRSTAEVPAGSLTLTSVGVA
ncbi:DUF6624 domain-containing protein [Streptomyces sp. NPDC046385]|uniref:DUF6624 domain-containing protein n=1 Tax=Streptomyces sp. NPDC046385 TaxID=3154918 RepID=UPI0033CFCBF0